MGSHRWLGLVRGFAHGSPAVIEGSTPMGSPASRCGLGAWWPFRRMGYPLRRDAIHRVSPVRGAAPRRHSSSAVGRPGGERRDESRLYVADFPCGRVAGCMPRGCRPHRVVLLITAGKRSAPAERNPTLFRPHGVELHPDVVQARGCVARGLGRCLHRAVRGCACGVPAVA